MAVVRCVRAYPARLSVAQPRDLSLLRFRRPFADTGGDLSLSTSESHSTYNVTISSIPFQLRVKLEANDGKFRIRLQSFSAQVEGSDRRISSTSRLRVGIHHDWRLRLQTTTYVRPKSATRAEVYLVNVGKHTNSIRFGELSVKWQCDPAMGAQGENYAPLVRNLGAP